MLSKLPALGIAFGQRRCRISFRGPFLKFDPAYGLKPVNPARLSICLRISAICSMS
jgi:hypothetical protein